MVTVTARDISRNATVQFKILEPAQIVDLVGTRHWEYLVVRFNSSTVLLGIDCMLILSTAFCSAKQIEPPQALPVTVWR